MTERKGMRTMRTLNGTFLALAAAMASLAAVAANNVPVFTSTGTDTGSGALSSHSGIQMAGSRLPTGTYTFECWFNLASFKSENHLFKQYRGGGAGRTIFFVNGATNPKFDFFIGGTHGKSTTTIQPNTWYHVACVRDDQLTTSTGRLYVNGVLETSITTFPMQAASDVNNFIGFSAGDTVNGGFNGVVAEMRVWNTARTQEEIVANMNRRLAGTEPGLWHYWPLNEGSGSIVADHATTRLTTPCDGVVISGSAGITWRQDAGLPISSMRDAAWSAGDGVWSSSANWLGGSVAGQDTIAFFTNNASAFTVTADSPVTLGGFNLDAPGGVTFQGSPFTLQENGLLVLKNGSATLNNALSIPGQYQFTLDSGTTLSAPGAVSGAGTLSCRGGIVSMPNATGLTGGLDVFSGTLENAGLGAPLTMRRATFRVTSDTTYAQPISRNTGNSVYAAVFDVPQGVTATVSGKLEKGVGAFLKTGAGTLKLTYPGTQYLSSGTDSGPALLAIDADGNGPLNGCFGVSLANGKLLLDGGDRQTNIVENGRMPVGVCTTTTGTETTAELEIRSGTLLYSPLYSRSFTLGRNNGRIATAPGGLSPTLTISGGNFIGASLIAFGYYDTPAFGLGISEANTTCRPVFRMMSGLLDTRELRLSESSGISCTATIDGGELHIWGPVNVAFLSNTVATLTLNGGVIDATNNVVCLTREHHSGATATLNLNGGCLYASNIRHLGGGTSTSHLNLNGGTFFPTAANTLTGLTEVVVRSGGAVFDTAFSDFTVAQPLLGDNIGSDGGLSVRGEHTLTLDSEPCTYAGPTVVSYGTLRVVRGLPVSTRLNIDSGGTFRVSPGDGGSVNVGSVVIGSSATIAFDFDRESAIPNGTLNISDISGLTGSLEIRLLQANGQDFSDVGTYTLFMFSEGTPDISGLSIANPAYGKAYGFSLDSVNNCITLTIGLDTTEASIWNQDANGAWNRAACWTVAPVSSAGAMARFDDKITAPRTVTVNGATAGALWFNNANAYKLAGNGMTLENAPASEPARITVESGSHAITAPITLGSPLALTFNAGTGFTFGSIAGAAQPISVAGNGTLTLTGDVAASALALDGPSLSAAGTLTVTAPVSSTDALSVAPATDANLTIVGALTVPSLSKTGSSVMRVDGTANVEGMTTVSGGTLALSSPVAGPITLGRATLRATESMTLPGVFTRATGNNAHGAVIAVDEGKVLTLSGEQKVTGGALVKTGKGTLRYTCNKTQTLNNHANDAPNSPISIGANGDGPTSSCVGITVTDGRLVFDAPAQTNNVTGGRIVVGGCTTTQAGAETTGELEVRQGTLNAGASMTVGRNNGSTTTAPAGLEPKLLITGGNLSVSSTLGVGYFDNGNGITAANVTMRPWVVVTNGSLQAECIRVCEANGIPRATLDVSGGVVRWTKSSEGITLGYGANTVGICNLSGDGVIEPANGSANSTFALTRSNSGATGILNLNGGTLHCGNIAKGGTGANCTAIVNFNGGTFRPTVDAQTMTGLTSASVSTNGAVFDLSEVAGFTVAQPLLHGGEAETDGGVVKRGAGTLTLSAADSTFNGPLRVEAGTLAATVCSSNALDIAGGATFDARSQTAVIGGLAGCGAAVNGTLAATGRIEPGTNAVGQSSLTVASLRLEDGATFACNWKQSGSGYVCPTLAVTDSLAFAGKGTVDFGVVAGAPAFPFGASCVLMTYESGAIAEGASATWKAARTGLDAALNAVLTAKDGKVTVTLCSSGTIVIFR